MFRAAAASAGWGDDASACRLLVEQLDSAQSATVTSERIGRIGMRSPYPSILLRRWTQARSTRDDPRSGVGRGSAHRPARRPRRMASDRLGSLKPKPRENVMCGTFTGGARSLQVCAMVLDSMMLRGALKKSYEAVKVLAAAAFCPWLLHAPARLDAQGTVSAEARRPALVSRRQHIPRRAAAAARTFEPIPRRTSTR